MLVTLNKTEIGLIYNIVDKALKHSGNSFSSFINKPVQIEIIDINAWDSNEWVHLQNLEDDYVLISDLKGDMLGRCYLCLRDSEAKSLFKLVLPPEYITDEDMKNGILIELDNILTAAVVTVFSNALNLNCYAYVPELLRITPATLGSLVERDITEKQFSIFFKTKFMIQGVDMSAEFIWVLEKSFMEKILAMNN